MNRSQIVGLAIVLASIGSGNASALSTRLHPGARVRVTPTDLEVRLEGTVIRADRTALALDVPGRREEVIIPTARVQRLELSTRQRSRGTRFVQGAGLGLLVGAVAGAIVGFSDGDDPPNTLFSATAEQKAGAAAAALGIVGGTVGGFIGLATPRNVGWVDVPVTSPGVALALAPGNGRELALVASRRF